MNEWKKEGRLYRKWIGASYAGILSKAEMLNVLFDDAQIQLQDDFVYKKKKQRIARGQDDGLVRSRKDKEKEKRNWNKRWIHARITKTRDKSIKLEIWRNMFMFNQCTKKK